MGFWSRWKRTFRADVHDRAIEEELQYHLAMKEQDGSDRRAARLRFGNLAAIKAETRAAGMLPWLESTLRDGRYAWHRIRKTPLFTAVLVLSLALGIAGNTAIFSVVDAALLQPLPVPDPGSLRLVEWTNGGFPDAFCNMLSGDTIGDEHYLQGSSIAARVYRDLARHQHGFASLVGFSDSSKAAVMVERRRAEQYLLQYVSQNFFAGLGVPLQLGHTFSAADDQVGQPPLVVVSDRFWRSQLGGRPDVIGKVVRINNVTAEIAGVARPGFFGLQIGEWVDLYAPLAAELTLSPRAKLDPTFGHTDRYWWVRMMARLNPAVPESRAAHELSTRFQRAVLSPGVRVDSGKVPRLITLPGRRGIDPIGTDESRALWISFALVALILLIVCANVANLLLSRAAVRQREAAVCLALGAGRLRLFRQYLAESLLIALLGGTAALWLSLVLAGALNAYVRTTMDIGGFDVRTTWHVFGFTCAVSFATALLCGVAPAWVLAQASIHDALKANNRTLASGRLRLPRLLVIAQIAMSFVVLVAAGLLGRSLANLRTVDIGFNQSNLVYASVNPWSAGYRPSQVDSYVEQLRAAVISLPGTLEVATVESRPLSGSFQFAVPNIPSHSFRFSDLALVNHVSDGFFKTLGIPLLAGRTFLPSDTAKNSDSVIVDEQFARQFYGNHNPLGEEFGLGPKPPNRLRIIGVVKSSRYDSLREAARPMIFFPSASSTHPGSPVNFAIRTVLPGEQLSRAFQKASSNIDPRVPVLTIETQTELIDRHLRSERLLSIFSGAFGLLALVLCSIGLVGLLSYLVTRRRNEIGIRMALGAGRGRVAGMVVRDAVLLLSIGLAAGIPGSVKRFV